jgi:serine/threonine protein kinase
MPDVRMNSKRVNAAKELMKRIAKNNGKKWPNLNNTVFGSGTNGLIMRTRNNPDKLLKITLGNSTKEVNTMKKLQNSGFVPKLNNNFTTIRKINTNLKANLFPEFWFGVPGPSSFPNSPATNAKKRLLSVYMMNRVGNATLRSYVKSGASTNNNKLQIRKAIRDAIVFMHSKGISHGDLHAGNILVEIDPVTKKMKKIWVIDFGRSVNIQMGKTEANAYQALKTRGKQASYNLFNPKTQYGVMLYNAGRGASRKNTNLYTTTYGGNLKNLNTHGIKT